MSVTANTEVVGLNEPDMSRAAWVASLANTPAAVDSDESYDRVWKHRLSHAFARSVFRHESSDGTEGICAVYDTKSPGNTRSSRTGKGHVLQIPGRGPFVQYDTWADGWEDLAFRLVDPTFVYAKEGRTTIAEIIPRWAPSSDNNVPASYIAAVVKHMNNWRENGDTPVAKPKIALSAGHHNSDRGGTAGEQEHTGLLTREIAQQLGSHGDFDLRVITPENGMGYFDGDLYDTARQVVVWSGQGWTADLFLEVHFEGNGAGNAGRGSFAIYPDWGDDVDVDVRDRLGPSMALKLREAAGVPLRGNGTMSERSTGVGSKGSRLGVFRATEDVKATCTRLIYEFGALTSGADRALIETPGYHQKAAGAVVSAVTAFYGLEVREPQQPQPEPDDALYVPKNPFGRVPITLGFKAMFERIGQANYPSDPIAGAVAVLGYPMGPEYETAEGSAQVFERAVLLWDRGADKPWDVVVSLRSEGIPEPKAA